MHINLNSEETGDRLYRLSVVGREKARAKVQALLEAGVVRESDYECASSVVLIPKKNGDVCVDYRALNDITVKVKYPLLLVEDHLDKLAGTCFT